MRNDPESLLSTTEVAAMCGVASMTVIRWIDSGALPAVRTPGGWRRVRRADAERHAAKVAGRTEAPALSHEDIAALMTSGRRDALVEWARAHAGSGVSVSELVRTKLAPAMRLIGDRWERGETAIGDEHRATVLAYELLALLRDVLPGGSPRGPDAPRLLLLCPPGEAHALPARMAAERFVEAGWRVDDLGANVPATEVVRQLERTNPDALGISVTTSLAGGRAVLDEVASSGWTGPVVVGGALADSLAQGRGDLLVDDGSDEFVSRVVAQLPPREARP